MYHTLYHTFRAAAALVLARELRRKGQWIELGEGSFRLNKSFEAADKTARQIVILVFSN
jgi:histidyl-tRNA synthetase